MTEGVSPGRGIAAETEAIASVFTRDPVRRRQSSAPESVMSVVVAKDTFGVRRTALAPFRNTFASEVRKIGTEKRGRGSLRRTSAHRIGLPEATYAKDASRDRYGNLSPFRTDGGVRKPASAYAPPCHELSPPSANDVPEKGTVENLGRQRKNPVPFLTKETGNPVSETDAPISKRSERRAAEPRPHVRSGP